MAETLSKGPGARNSPANANPSQLQELGRKSREFANAVARFMALKDVPADMRDEYKSIAAKLGKINKSIEVMTGGVQKMASWVGLSGPAIIIPLAMYGTILAGLTYGYKIAAGFTQRLEARRADAARIAETEGVPYSAALVKAGATGGGIFSGLGTPLMLFALAGAAWLILGKSR